MNLITRFRLPPGPRQWPLSGNLYHLKNDILKKLLDDHALFGPILKYRIGHYKYIVLNDPAYIRHVLLEHKDNYSKQTLSNEESKHITGDSLLTMHGKDWHTQRRRMQGAFRRKAVGLYYNDMLHETDHYIQQCHQTSGTAINLPSDMSTLTYSIVCKALFGVDTVDTQQKIQESLDIALDHVHSRVQSLIRLPLWGYTPGQRKFKKAIREFNTVVNNIIQQRINSTEQPDDLLQKLLMAVDEKDNSSMSHQQIRNELITLLLAGHETTANLMTWCLYELASQEPIQQQLYNEVKDIDFNQMDPTQLSKLTVTYRVIQETLRLYPPVWLMERHAIKEDYIQEFKIPKNTTIVINPWVMHRHPEFWRYPNEFNIDNFLPDNFNSIPDYVFIPFGKGPRMCIGMNFAIQESIIMLGKIMQNFIIDQATPKNAKPDPSITLRPQKDMQVRLTSR